MLDHYFKGHSQDNIIELAWLLNRVPARNMYRKIEIIESAEEAQEAPVEALESS